jgi:multidrug resistance efflux pump
MSDDQQKAGETMSNEPEITIPADSPEVVAPVEAPPASWSPPPKDRRTIAVIVLLVILAILTILYAWNLPPFSDRFEQTDNAYVRGKTTVISPQVSGYVTQVPVQDFQTVRPGDVLVRIEDRIYAARVEQARANVLAQMAGLDNSTQAERSREANALAQDAAIGNAQAQLERARADMRRVDALVADGSVSLRERDQTRAALRQAEAQLRQAGAAREIARQDIRSVTVGRGGLKAGVEAANAQLHLAQIDLEHSVIRAPEGGQLSEIGVRNGQFVTAGTQLMFLVPRQLWVIANFKEAQTRNMRAGQVASVKVDALGGETLTGRIQSLAPAAGSEFAVLKADNATGNFVKVAQRMAVRITIDPRQPLADRLRPGMSVTARVDTGNAR